MKIAVIMSTYNGEKYLREQMDSVLAQRNIDIDIYIRDDGSTDNTIPILKEYESNNTNIYLDYNGHNLGFVKSFIKTLITIENEYDYYAFCDQDDFWEDNKIYNAIKLFNDCNQNKDMPVIYYSNLNICDEKLNFLYRTKLEKRKHTLESCLLRNSIAGCTMVFNKSFYKLIKDKMDINILNVKSHDSFFISLCYSLDGKVICDNNSYISYRKHSSNASGSTNSLLKRIKREYKIFCNKGDKSKLAVTILNLYGNKINSEKKDVLLTFAYSNRIKNRIKILFNSNYSTGDIVLTIFAKMKAVLGLL